MTVHNVQKKVLEKDSNNLLIYSNHMWFIACHLQFKIKSYYYLKYNTYKSYCIKSQFIKWK